MIETLLANERFVVLTAGLRIIAAGDEFLQLPPGGLDRVAADVAPAAAALVHVVRPAVIDVPLPRGEPVTASPALGSLGPG